MKTTWKIVFVSILMLTTLIWPNWASAQSDLCNVSVADYSNSDLCVTPRERLITRTDGSTYTLVSCDITETNHRYQALYNQETFRNTVANTNPVALRSFNDSAGVCRVTAPTSGQQDYGNAYNNVPVQPQPAIPPQPPVTTPATVPTASLPPVATGGGINVGQVAAGAAITGVGLLALNEFGVLSGGNSDTISIFGQGTDGNVATVSQYLNPNGQGYQFLNLQTTSAGISYRKQINAGVPVRVTGTVGYGKMTGDGEYILAQTGQAGQTIVTNTLVDQSKSGFDAGLAIQADVVKVAGMTGTVIAGADMSTYSSLGDGTALGAEVAARLTAPIGNNLGAYVQGGLVHSEGVPSYDLGTRPRAEVGLVAATKVGNNWMLKAKGYGAQEFGTKTSDFVSSESTNLFGAEVAIGQLEGSWDLGLSFESRPAQEMKSFNSLDTNKIYLAKDNSIRLTLTKKM